MKWLPSASAYKKDAGTVTRSGSPNFSPALNVRSNTARVMRLRILTRTSVWPPRAVGFDTSTSRQWYGAFSYSKNILRLRSIASMSAAMASAIVVLSACVARSPAAPARSVERARVAMGSELRVTAWTADEAGALSAFDAVFNEFDRLESLMSTWRPGSDVERLNAAAGEQPVRVSSDVVSVLEAARQASEWTGGKFDVTFGALSGLWKFDHDRDDTIPDMREVRARLPLIDYRALKIDPEGGTAFLERRGMSVNLGGIGKGYALDRGIAILRARGFNDFLIRAGGDMYAAGHRGGQPWRVGIQDPRGPGGRAFARLAVWDST